MQVAVSLCNGNTTGIWKAISSKKYIALLCGLLRIVHSNGTKYTNRSLWATATSRMFLNNVPEKIIAEKTGHRSLAGLRAYGILLLLRSRQLQKV